MTFERMPESSRRQKKQIVAEEKEGSEEFLPGQSVKVTGFDGTVEDGWTVQKILHNDSVLVAKLRGPGNDSHKIIPTETLRALNS